MTTVLQKTVKRELRIRGRAYIVAISPETLKLTLKGKRKGIELQWEALVSGDAALAAALNASLGNLDADSVGGKVGDANDRPPSSPRRERSAAARRGRKQVV